MIRNYLFLKNLEVVSNKKLIQDVSMTIQDLGEKLKKNNVILNLSKLQQDKVLNYMEVFIVILQSSVSLKILDEDTLSDIEGGIAWWLGPAGAFAYGILAGYTDEKCMIDNGNHWYCIKMP